MPTMEEFLVKETYKEQGLDVAQRVFYTLIGEEGNPHREKLQAHRTAKAVALLFKTLSEIGSLTEKRLDDILLDVVS